MSSGKDLHIWEQVGSVVVTRTLPGPIPDEVWNEFIRYLDSPRAKTVFSVVAGTVTINALQRKMAADTLRTKKMNAVVLTEDRLTRGIITAISWMGANIKSFAWKDREAAINYADVSKADQIHLTEVVNRYIADIERFA